MLAVLGVASVEAVVVKQYSPILLEAMGGRPVSVSRPACTDSDNGRIFAAKGAVTSNWPGWDRARPAADTCAIITGPGTYLYQPACEGANCYFFEFFCEGARPQRSVIACASGCRDGVCKHGSVSPAPETEEAVTCLFLNSRSTQWCDSPRGTCEGKESCLLGIRGSFGERLMWKSTCHGSGETVIDGTSEFVRFLCKPG